MYALRALSMQCAGYVAAVAIAAAVTVFGLVVATGLVEGRWPETAFDPAAWWVVGCVWTFPTALPGFLLTLALAIATGSRSAGFFAAAGTLDVAPALLLFNGWGGGSVADMPPMILVFSFPGGLAGGLAYWRVGGRRRFPRSAMVSSIAKPGR